MTVYGSEKMRAIGAKAAVLPVHIAVSAAAASWLFGA